MTDRELLTLAAKAAGIEIAGVSDMYWKATGVVCRCEGSVGWFTWRPLHDDGAALRLAVKLRINIYNPHGDRDVSASCWIEKTDIVRYFDQRSDTEDATRRAIVRAAAAIGETL